MEQVVDGVYQVSAGVNAFVVDGDQGVVLIDTGLPGRHGAIADGLRSIGRRTGDVSAIVLTHGHGDHTGGGAALLRDSGATVVASTVDAPVVEGRRPMPPPPLLDRPLLRHLVRLVPKATPFGVDYAVDGAGDVPVVDDMVVIPTPGHTAGHVSYLLDRVGGVMFVGDAAMVSRRGAVVRGFMNRPSPTFDASLRRLAERQFETACFGHSPPLAIGASGAFRAFADAQS